jgi:hypothetical protein
MLLKYSFVLFTVNKSEQKFKVRFLMKKVAALKKLLTSLLTTDLFTFMICLNFLWF